MAELSYIQGLQAELGRLEAELEYQVSHKRIAALQERINEIEEMIENEKANNNICGAKE